MWHNSNYPIREESNVVKCEVRPLGDRVAVVREEPEGKSKGGILLPDVAKEKPKRGKVVSVGPGNRTKEGRYLELEVKVGDTVLFLAYAGSEVEVDGVEYLILSTADVVAVLE